MVPFNWIRNTYNLLEHLWWEHNIIKCSNLIICGHLNIPKFIPQATPPTSLELLQGEIKPCAQRNNKCLIRRLLKLCWYQSIFNVEKPNSEFFIPVKLIAIYLSDFFLSRFWTKIMLSTLGFVFSVQYCGLFCPQLIVGNLLLSVLK